MLNNKVRLQSYVHSMTGDWFFISTINKKVNIEGLPEQVVTETIVTRCYCENDEILVKETGLRNSIDFHMELVRGFYELGEELLKIKEEK